MKGKGWIWLAALAAVAALLYFLQGGRVVKVERRVIVDTIRYYMPVEKGSTITRYVIARLPAAKPKGESPAQGLKTAADTIYLPAAPAAQQDSADVVLPIEQKHYAGSEYDAWISGYMPKLDSIRIYSRDFETTITKIGKRHRWGVGINAGIGLTGQGAAPYIGIGVSYSLFSF